MSVALISQAPAVVGNGPVVVAALVAAAAGLVSFLSPCVLPLVPGYLSYVTGLSGAELAIASEHVPVLGGQGTGHVLTATKSGRGRVLAGSVLFVLGFTAVFVSYGATFGDVGRRLILHREAVDQVLGSLTIAMGLLFSGALTRVPFLQREFRLHRKPAAGLVGAPILGVLFGLGWTPCLGPTLGVITGLALESGTAGRGAVLSFAYCLGLGIPFVVTGLLFRRALGAFAVVKRHYRAVMLTGGGLLVVLGILEVSGVWASVLVNLQSYFGSFRSPL